MNTESFQISGFSLTQNLELCSLFRCDVALSFSKLKCYFYCLELEHHLFTALPHTVRTKIFSYHCHRHLCSSSDKIIPMSFSPLLLACLKSGQKYRNVSLFLGIVEIVRAISWKWFPQISRVFLCLLSPICPLLGTRNAKNIIQLMLTLIYYATKIKINLIDNSWLL